MQYQKRRPIVLCSISKEFQQVHGNPKKWEEQKNLSLEKKQQVEEPPKQNKNSQPLFHLKYSMGKWNGDEKAKEEFLDTIDESYLTNRDTTVQTPSDDKEKKTEKKLTGQLTLSNMWTSSKKKKN